MPETQATLYFPEYQMDGQWKRWIRRGQEVRFESEPEARAFLQGVVFPTRIEIEHPITDVSQKGVLNGNRGFSLLR